MKGIDPRRFITVEYLLAFLFCGAVVGETISLSIVVTTAGPDIIGKLYLVNASVLLLVPLLFFRHIDRINRSTLLGSTLLATISAIAVVFVAAQLFPWPSGPARYVIVLLYPVAYLSKTVLFLTFWTLLNDLYTMQEAKRRFPVIAAWGFGGALGGVFIARLLIAVASVQTVIMLWIGVYLVAWVYTKEIGSRFMQRLQPGEEIPATRKSFFGVGDLLSVRLIRIMAAFYFFTFITVFSVDFLFWKKCCEWFITSESVASFQFSFYLIHATTTIVLLRFALPKVIDRVGFTRILYGLPAVFIIGGAVLFIVNVYPLYRLMPPLFVVVQFFRYVFFEITFAPSYQMFFAAFAKEQRGRAKTLLDGIVKPTAILASGIVLVSCNNGAGGLSAMIAGNGALLFVIVFFLRRVYRTTIMHEFEAPLGMETIIEEAGRREDGELYRLIGKYVKARESDMRAVAIHLLKRLGSDQALAILKKMYDKEHDIRLKEMIARSMSAFFGYQAKPFIERLLHENNRRIRANTIYALNTMHCNWKRHLKMIIAPFIFENSRRIQLEAARFLWQYGSLHERNTVLHFLQNLLDSQNTDRRSAGLYLAGSIRVPGWESTLLANLNTASLQVYTKSIEILVKNASEEVIQKTLEKIDTLSRRHISIAGKILEAEGSRLWNTLAAFLPRARNRRFLFEIVSCLSKIADTIRSSGRLLSMAEEAIEVLRQWIMKELESVYRDAYHFNRLIGSDCRISSLKMLENALREQQTRLCVWALSAMIVSDRKGDMIWRHAEIDINEIEQRNDLIEVFESASHEKMGSLILPLLKQESWDGLLKIGKTHFHFNHVNQRNALCVLVTSENMLTALSALSAVEINLNVYAHNKDVEETLNMLAHEKNKLISSAAKNLLERKKGAAVGREKAFELLENVIFIKQTSLFHAISTDKLLRLVEMARRVVYRKGEVVSAEGRAADQLYIVKSGGILVEKTIDGERTFVAVVNPGQTYGEIGLFSRAVRETAATAQEESEIFIIKGSDIRRLIKETPEVAINLLESVSKRLFRFGEMAEKLRTADRTDNRPPEKAVHHH
ncbi:MAG: cyclic nucleotide-binding domain-containing protein [Chitinispirillaceae bacterium]|nr:cyclic nucleotide-binding domain-containing protein [Chitinispirillaceae bacterium]